MCLGRSWIRSRARGEKRQSRGARGIARVSLLTGALGRLARVRAGAGGGRKRRWATGCRVEDVEEHRRARWGGPRCLAGGGYSAGAHCSALQSAQMACHGILYALWARPLMSGSSRRE